jgi:hypothetical protein|eukprot:COSAG06_NODE_4746_length_3986_cov_24.001286_4_plen_69_part_00
MASVVAKCGLGIDLYAAIVAVHPMLIVIATVPLHFFLTVVLYQVIPGFQTSVITAGVKWETEQASKSA